MTSPLAEVRQPAYTGENRCLPCTVVNIVIAAIGSIILALASASVLLAGIVFGVCLGIIYLRGYLVPRTPTLTKQYLPDYVLRWFGKSPTMVNNTKHKRKKEVHIDPEQILLDAGIVTPCQNGTDLCLRSTFRGKWHERQHAIQHQHLNSTEIRDILDSSPKDSSVERDIEIEEYDDGLVATAGTELVGKWPSSTAVVADVAAAKELAERSSDWEQMHPIERARVLMSLRIFINKCPACGGTVQVTQDVVDSCCMSQDVVVSACQNCTDELFEIEWESESVQLDEEN